MRHPRLAGTVIAGAVLGLGVLPAHASPAETVVLDDVVATIADDTNDLVAFANTTREAFCTAEMLAAENAFLAWLEGGMVGEPPEFPNSLGAVELVGTAKDVGTGNVRFSFAGTVPGELWTFEEGKSAIEGNIVAPCIDTDGLLDGTTTTIGAGELFAAGEATWSFKDNDADGIGPRTNVWGDRIVASLSGPGGDYTYTVVFKNQGRDGEYLKGSASFTLRAR